MMPARIPVKVLANDPIEYRAINDVLIQGGGDPLCAVGEGEAPYAAIICPSGDLAQAGEMPCVVIEDRSRPVTEAIHSISVPCTLYDVFNTLILAVQAELQAKGPRVYSGWELDTAQLLLQSPVGESIALTDTEARLLLVLFDASGAELDRDTLLQRVWGYKPGLDTHTLETHIYRLRQKMESNPTNPSFLMTTERGYRLSGS